MDAHARKEPKIRMMEEQKILVVIRQCILLVLLNLALIPECHAVEHTKLWLSTDGTFVDL